MPNEWVNGLVRTVPRRVQIYLLFNESALWNSKEYLARYLLRRWLNELAGAENRRVLGKRFAPDVVAEPVEIRLHDGAVGFRLGDRVAETLIEDQARRDVLVLQAAIELESVGNRERACRRCRAGSGSESSLA